MRTFDREQLAWCAGFFDGEGCVCLSKKNIRIQIFQCDRDVLDRFMAATQMGIVRGPYASAGRPRGREQWCWYVDGFEKVQATIAILWRNLGSVKKTQARPLLKGMISVNRV